jgi:hypothetical protein
MTENKWSSPTFHALESTRELHAAESHLVQYISQKNSDPTLLNLLSEIRNLRKKIEDYIFNGQ